METTRYPHGTFNWVDLATDDPAAAKTFYAAVFDWQYKEHDAGEGGVYIMVYVDDKPALAMYRKRPEMPAGHAFWVSYVSVDDVEAAAARVKELGGKVHAGPMDVMDEGRMAMVTDPGGAGFALWQPLRHHGAHVVNQPNTLCWNELYTRSLEQAEAFYSELLGWATEPVEMPGAPPMLMAKVGDRGVASVMAIQPEWGEVPPHWMVYFAVDDCDAAASRATEAGGQVIMPARDIPPVGRFAVLQDPQGGVFSVIKLFEQT